MRAMRRVHLPDVGNYFDSFPHQISGGQLQRVVLARALVLEPTFLVADEPVSMLDVSVRAGVLNVMREVRDAMGLTALYVSHDISMVPLRLRAHDRDVPGQDRRGRPDGGRGARSPAPLYPGPGPSRSRPPRGPVPRSLPITGHVPDARTPPSGCRFRDRCPHAIARCAEEEPAMREIAPGRRAACHLHGG